MIVAVLVVSSAFAAGQATAGTSTAGTSTAGTSTAGQVGVAAVYPGCTIDATYQQGARGEAVHCIEQALRAKSFQWGHVDTFYGTTTVTAVRNFQWANRLLPLTGVVDERVATALGIWGPAGVTTTVPATTAPPTTAPPTTAPPTTAPPTTPPPTTTPAPSCTVSQQLSVSMRGADVACLEQVLRTRGFQSSHIDDYFGVHTRDRGVKNAERSYALPVDGVADPTLLQQLGIWLDPPPPPTTAPPTTVPGGSPPTGTITIISDSAMAGVRWNGALGGFRGATFDARLQSCRRLVYPSCRGREAVAPKTTKDEIDGLPTPAASDVLVVATGYNDWESRFSSDFDIVIAAARQKGFRHIAWVTYRSQVTYGLPRSSLQRFANYGVMNAILRAKVNSGAFPEVVLWDLDGYTATGANGWFTTDGVHERKLGSWGVADWVSRHVAAMAGRPCPMPWVPGGTIESPCPNPDTVVAARGLPNIRALYGL